MRTFHNPLEHVLKARTLQQKQQEAVLAAAVAARAAAEAALQATEAEAGRAARFLPAAENRTKARALLARERFIEHQQQRREEQQKAVAEARETVAREQNALVQARRETRKLELHRDKALEKWQAEARKDEQRQHDDLAAARFVLLRREPDQRPTL
jgi:flagellar export protein FliJ